MIRPTDAFILAQTKLRTHKVRTGLTVGIAGILFGLIFAVVFVVQGVFDSVARFDKEGLSGRSIVLVSQMNFENYPVHEYLDDVAFIAEVEALHEASVVKKKAAAMKHQVEYDATQEGPSPVSFDPERKKKVISEDNIGNTYVVAAAKARAAKQSEVTPFDIHEFVRPYTSAKVLSDYYEAMPVDGALTYMKGGKEKLRESDTDDHTDVVRNNPMSGPTLGDVPPMVMNGHVTQSFVTSQTFDASSGEIPVIIPYSQAADLLGLVKLDKKATAQERLDRLDEVRRRVGDITIDYCYRNTASQQLLQEALAQEAERERLKEYPNIDYVEPDLQYKVPSNTSCGPVEVVKDVRSVEERQQQARQIAYEKEIGTYIGGPMEQKITMRGVGITGEMASEYSFGAADAVISLLGSNLGWGALAIPADMLRDVPAEYRPEAVFVDKRAGGAPKRAGAITLQEASYLVEFGDKDEARELLSKTGALGGEVEVAFNQIFAMQFGSNALLIDEFKKIFSQILLWTLLTVGGIAATIMGSMIGRTVSEGRRESAVFRAIGAKRSDIASIYGYYALLLSMRVGVFALVLGGVIGFIVELVVHQSATVGARLAYAASDASLEFHLFSALSWYVPLIIGVILVVGMVASSIPILRSVRRNPITDMRDDS